MCDLQLSSYEFKSSRQFSMLPPSLRRSWLKNKRRLSDVRGIVERKKFKSIRHRFYDDLWRDAASAVGAEAETQPNGLVRISRMGLSTFVDQSDIMLDSAIASRLLLNKSIIYRWLDAKGLRIPHCASYDLSTIHRAEEFLAQQEGPVVVKPADGTGCGHGVTTGITDIQALHAASRHAAAFNAQLLIEEQLAGASFRLLYLDGEFVDAVRRDPPLLRGNGKANIRELAHQENEKRRTAHRITALSPLIIDRESRNTLAAQGMSANSTPSNGEVVQVKLAVNENAADQNHAVRDEVHEEIIEAGKKVVRDLGIGFAGLDVTSCDISVPVLEGHTVFNEINAGPGIHHHYLVANPAKAVPVASYILDYLFSRRRGVMEL